MFADAKRDYDLAVIGGGPAGAAAAWRAARHGLRTLLVERGALPRDRVCGEFVSAEALPLLRRILAATRPDLIALSPLIAELRLGGRRFRLPLPGRGIPRLELDAALWEAALAAGVEGRLRTEARRLQSGAGGYRLYLRAAGGESVITARAVIAAPGRWWRLEGLRGEAENARELPHACWVGVKAHLRRLAAEAVELYFFPGGYCGLAPVGRGMVNACCLARRDTLKRPGAGLEASSDFPAWLAAAAREPGLERRLQGALQAAPTVVTAPVRLGRARRRRGEVRLAGDAAGFIDPFTGEGIARALFSGYAAAAECLPLEALPWREALTLSQRRPFLASGALRLGSLLPAPLRDALLRLPGAAALVGLAFHGTRCHAA